MRVSKINHQVFKGQNIDMHMHEGTWLPESTIYAPEDTFELIGKPISINIAGQQSIEEIKYSFVSNLDCMTFNDDNTLLKNELDGNLEMLAECRKHPQKRPYAVCQAGYGSAENIEKLLKENPNSFIGLKFHPNVFKQDANSAVYEPYMKIAEKYKLPCLFHSDKTGSYGCPHKIYELAKKFPKVPVILAHLGAGTDHTDAINVLLDSIETGSANLYGDTSWIDCKNPKMPTIKNLIERLQNTSKGDQTFRLLYGSDAPLGEFGASGKKIKGFYADNLQMLKNMIYGNFKEKAAQIADNICFNNSKILFLDGRITNMGKVTKLSQKTLITAGIALVGLAAGLTAVLKHKHNEKQLQNDNSAKNPYSSFVAQQMHIFA